MENIKLTELLGNNIGDTNYGVTTNWRINFGDSLKALMGGGANSAITHMSYACHSDFQFEATVDYAEATVKGMHISQAAWQDRFIDSMDIEIYDTMDLQVFKALVKAANNTAGYYNNRDINAKGSYTLKDIKLIALGNGEDNSVKDTLTYTLHGVQINSVQSPNYTTGDAEITSVSMNIRAHGWTVDGELLDS